MVQTSSIRTRDYTSLLNELGAEHARRSPRSAEIDRRARQVLVDGGSHTLRLIQPFPPRITSAHGAWLTDADGHHVLDLWQGHLANILGHNPEIITRVLEEAFADGSGLQTGMTDELQVEVAELLCKHTGAERVRLTTSGSLATMYAMMLARVYTGREVVLKAGGGWHGAQPWGLKGVGYTGGYGVDSEGLSDAVAEQVMVTYFNEPDMLEEPFAQYGDRIACLILEPMMGAGGLVAAQPEYLQTARKMTEKYGALLILDEVITGFRFRAGSAAALYGIQPDLATYGKIIGGGMPVAAVGGRADVMNLVSRAQGMRVKFSGGTFAGHPAAMLAARAMMTYLVAHQSEIYPRLAALGAQARDTMVAAFREQGIYAVSTGVGNAVYPGSSLAGIYFPYKEDTPSDKPHVLFDPALYDVTLSNTVLELALLVEDVHLLHAHGAVSTAHTEADIAFLGEACRGAARRIRAAW